MCIGRAVHLGFVRLRPIAGVPRRDALDPRGRSKNERMGGALVHFVPSGQFCIEWANLTFMSGPKSGALILSSDI